MIEFDQEPDCYICDTVYCGGVCKMTETTSYVVGRGWIETAVLMDSLAARTYTVDAPASSLITHERTQGDRYELAVSK